MTHQINAWQTAVALWLAAFGPAAALAHEPLWGESPQTFAFGVFHPEIRFGYDNASVLLGGSRRLHNPDSLRRSRLDSLVSLAYAPETWLNVKLEVPFAQVASQQRIAGSLRSSTVSGTGDLVLSAKTRFEQRFGPDWKFHQSATVGLQLPTGERGGRMPDGSLLAPSDQPGSGRFGLSLGYAVAYERLADTTWASVMFRTDAPSGKYRRGDSLMADAAYGYWVRRALRPQDEGLLLALGPHLEMSGKDRAAGASDPNSGYTSIGLQATFIRTQGQTQTRIGILVPLHQHVAGTQLRSDLQIRAGWEMLL